MLKKTISYEDFEGNMLKEPFYFNISKGELLEMEMAETTLDEDGNATGGMQEKLRKISESRDGQIILDAFRDILKMSYGVKSEDGKRFIKSDELFEEFTQTNAYSELLMELGTDAKAAADFVNGILPSDFVSPKDNRMDKIREKMKEANLKAIAEHSVAEES